MKFNFPGIYICLQLFITAAWSQPINYSSSTALAEKIYLQLDNRVYTTDQTIWFKAIVVNAVDHTPGKLSRVLYVDIIDPNETVVEHKLIKLELGIGNGFFQLAPNYAHGIYQIRAYTEWDKNFGSRFFYKEYIMVSGPESQPERNGIQNVTVVEKDKSQRSVQVSLEPDLINGTPNKNIPIIITSDEKRDTIIIRKNRSDQYVLDYPLPLQSRFVTFEFESRQHIRYSRTVILDTAYLDVQFFPESGELIQGLSSLIGLKVVRYDGKGEPAMGSILNSKGLVVASFKTNGLGMGSVLLNVVDSNEHYTARILSPDGKAISKVYPLPSVTAKGTVLAIRKAEEKISLNVRSNYLRNDSIVVRASCRGIIYYDFKGQLKNGLFDYFLPSSLLPEGIIDFTLLTKSEHVAERLYFNERPESRIHIAASTDKQIYDPREKTALSMEFTDGEDKSVAAHISIHVFNQAGLGLEPDFRQNILSYFLLSSDLKGPIENPGSYFSSGNDHFGDLDALLLTQGWSKYHYSRDSISFLYNPEQYLTVSGNVKGGLSDKKIIKEANLTLMTFGKPPSFDKQITDSLGRFVFALEDKYGPPLGILIQSSNKSDKQKNYLITLDEKLIPQVEFDRQKLIQKPDSIVQAYIKKSIANKKAVDAFKIASEGVTLDTVVVNSRILSPEQKLVAEKYGQATVVIGGKEIRDKEEKWSYGLYSVLLFQFPDKVKIQRVGNGMLYASLYNFELTLVVIDGIPVKSYQYDIIPSIPPSEVKSFELIPYAKNFFSLYCDVVPSCDPLKAPITGNVIAIYTYAGKGLEGVRPTVGLKNTTIPVFAPTREFYVPKYEQLKAEDWKKPDLRNLIHWAPDINTDTSGRYSLSYYNSDLTGRVKVVVEAISETGEIGYQELFYEVKKRE